jgi:hypothetical protein
VFGIPDKGGRWTPTKRSAMMRRMPDPEDLERATDDDPAVAFPAIGRLRDWLAAREVTTVRAARRRGWTWERIGDALGRARQTVWERYRHED